MIKHAERLNPGEAPAAGKGGLLAAAKSARDARRQRDQIFGRDLLADPCWDLLLDLFIAREEDRRMSIASACLSAPVSADTALRCISHLTDVGLVAGLAGPDESGSRYLVPTDRAAAKLTLYLTRLEQGRETSAA
jgi:hypothetical protein